MRPKEAFALTGFFSFFFFFVFCTACFVLLDAGDCFCQPGMVVRSLNCMEGEGRLITQEAVVDSSL
jgi:hypothetical protein